MKKLALLLAVCLITWSLAGCQTQPAPSSGETSASAGSVSSGGQPGSSLPEGDPVVVCINSDFEQDMEELLDYLSAIGVETEYELLVLPSRTEDREAELTRLRTEIMAGGGPDAFVLGAVLPGTMMDEGKSQEPLFPNVEKSMYSHLFLDLEDMAQNSEIVDLESCNQVVMDVGVTSQGRFLLPLTYTFSALLFDRSALNDPDYTFSTLEELLQSGEEALKGVMAWNTLGLFPNCLGPLADYEGQNLLVTQESLQAAVEQADAFVALQDEAYDTRELAYAGLGIPVSRNTLSGLQREETAYAVFPVPDQEGGVIAAVTTYAAINRNTEHPQEAFALIEQLFREELATQSSLEADGYHHCSSFSYGTNSGFFYSLPVKDQLALDYFAPNLQPDTMASLRAAMERMDSAKVYSDFDQTVYQMHDTWHWYYGNPEEPLEDLVERAISSMEMALAE